MKHLSLVFETKYFNVHHCHTTGIIMDIVFQIPDWWVTREVVEHSCLQ